MSNELEQVGLKDPTADSLGKLAIEKQNYNEPTKTNILKVYDEIDENQIFGTKK